MLAHEAVLIRALSSLEITQGIQDADDFAVSCLPLGLGIVAPFHELKPLIISRDENEANRTVPLNRN